MTSVRSHIKFHVEKATRAFRLDPSGSDECWRLDNQRLLVETSTDKVESPAWLNLAEAKVLHVDVSVVGDGGGHCVSELVIDQKAEYV